MRHGAARVCEHDIGGRWRLGFWRLLAFSKGPREVPDDPVLAAHLGAYLIEALDDHPGALPFLERATEQLEEPSPDDDAEDADVVIHELGHALSLPHWGRVESYPYRGEMHGIPAPKSDAPPVAIAGTVRRILG